ncbi:MAG: flagellar hook-length control protein FliK [Campylobacterota bacterium]|nr:flagellar hook-length control protein FliK [Campylobacterota bacterium]
MNINTSTLLTLLSTKVDKPTKQTIEKLSVDGKVDISSLLKEKSVQTLLSDLFKDLSQGVKNKSNVNQLLTSNKQIFDFKNLSNEVKNLSNLIEQNPKLEKQSAVLKEFLVNIKNIDKNTLKSNIKNSGVFLESKLLKSDTPLSSTIKTALGQIEEQILSSSKNPTSTTPKLQQQNIPLNKQEFINNIKNSIILIQDKIENLKVTIPESLKTEIKADISKVLEQIKTTPQNQPQEKNISTLNDIKSSINNIETKLIKLDLQNPQNTNNILNSKSIVSTDLKAAILQIQEQLESSKTAEMPKELKIQIDKIQTQIEFYQLLSYTSTSNHTFLPFTWEDLDDADIKFDTNDKDEFSCQINLSLRSAGELKVLLQLDNKNNLNINMGVESQSFKQMIQSNLQKLRVGINSVGLMIQSLNLFDIQSNETQTYEQNAYSCDKLNFGLDIKA